MARSTSEKATQMIGNKFDMVLVAAQRARELARGSASKMPSSNGSVITALREIEQGLYTKQDFMNSQKRIR